MKVAINGAGRIGRALVRLMLADRDFELVAVNDLMDVESIAYLLRFDTVYGRYPGKIAVDDGNLDVDGRRVRVLRGADPARLPWKELGVDLVFECTGALAKREDLEKHVQAGARFVLLSAPAKGGEVETVVHGASKASGEANIVSCASCTTNCITPVVEVVGRRIGLKKAIMTTVHAYTSTQALIDAPDKSFRKGRAAAANIVPATTGAARATTKALPQYAGLFDGLALRVPVATVSVADITFLTERETSVEEVNKVLSEEAESERYRNVLGVSSEPLVSSDIIADPRASIVDLGLTTIVDGDLVKVMSWYDNEWGYANQMKREARSLVSGSGGS